MIIGTTKVYVRTRRVKDGWKARIEVDGKSRTLSGIYQSATDARQAGLEACHKAIVGRLVMFAVVGLRKSLMACGQRLQGFWRRAVFDWRLMIDRYTIKLYRARSNRTRYNNCAGEQLTFP